MVRIVRIYAILMLFVVGGPPLGWVFGAMLSTFAMLSAGVSMTFGDFLMALIMGPFLSYIIGAVPSAIAGLMVGIKPVYFAGAGWRFALGVGALVGISLAAYVGMSSVPNIGYWRRVGGGYVFATIAATLGCWSIVKSWFVDHRVGRGATT